MGPILVISWGTKISNRAAILNLGLFKTYTRYSSVTDGEQKNVFQVF